MNITFKFDLRRCWIGIECHHVKHEPVCHCGISARSHCQYSPEHDFVLMREPEYFDVLICPLPFLMIHIAYSK